jgi:hypothetical protein
MIKSFHDWTHPLLDDSSFLEATISVGLELKWRIKLNESNSVNIDFTNNKIKQQPIFINGTKVLYVNTAKYLGMILDAKLRWKEHIMKKSDELNIKFRKKVLVAWTQF